MHDQHLKRGTLRRIIAQAGLTVHVEVRGRDPSCSQSNGNFPDVGYDWFGNRFTMNRHVLQN